MANSLMGSNMPIGPNNPFSDILKFLNGGGNPQQVFNMFMSKNPNMNKMMQQMQNIANGRSAKQFAMDLAKQQGLDINQMEELARRLGAK